jgi:translation initiation factor IF-3
MRAMAKFIGEGDKVKFTIRFRGRELAHPEIGRKLLDRIREEAEELAKIESMAKMEGRQMIMVMAPK